MNNRVPIPTDPLGKDWRLKGFLRQAAEAERPDFSPQLHEAIMARVSEANGLRRKSYRESAQQDAERHARFSVFSVFSVLSLYAAVLIVGLVVYLALTAGWTIFRIPGDQQQQAPPVSADWRIASSEKAGLNRAAAIGDYVAVPVDELVSVPNDTVQHLQLALTALEKQRWAQLDHDLKLAGEMLKEQLSWGLLSQADPSLRRATP